MHLVSEQRSRACLRELGCESGDHRSRSGLMFGRVRVTGYLRNSRSRATTISKPPNVLTTLSPLERSNMTEKNSPSTLARKPIVQPISNFVPVFCANNVAHTDGTIRKLNTSKTPAMCTLDVTTTPKDV